MFKWLFKKKKQVVDVWNIDEFSDDGHDLDVAILKVLGLCEKYGQTGMYSMTKEVHRQVGEVIMQRGLRRWQT